MSLKTLWRNNWIRRGIVYPIAAAGVAVALAYGAYKVEKETGILQQKVAEYVSSEATNQTQGRLWQDYNEYSQFTAKVTNAENPQRVSEGDFPDLSIFDHFPFVRDNRVTIKSSDGVTLVDRVSRIYVRKEDIPDHVQWAFLVKEDQDFKNHHGINLWGKVRATKINLEQGKLRTAGSGITEQLAKMVMAQQGKMPLRGGYDGVVQKLKEMAYATAIEGKFAEKYGEHAKDEIFATYLNMTYFGNGNYGIGMAAKNYFGKHVSQLSPPQALFLSLLPRNPATNPTNDENFTKLWHAQGEVITTLYKRGVISKAKRDELGKWRSVDIMEQVPNKQKLPSALGTFYAEMKEKDIDLVKIVTDPNPPFGFEAELTASMRMTRDFQKSVTKGFKHKTAQYGGTIVNQNGDIVAVLGQRNNKVWSNFNYATRPNEGLASTMKTILLAIGIQERIVSRYSTFNDTCEDLRDWCPRNHDRIQGREMTLEQALKNSNNRIYTKLYKKIKAKIGVEGFADYMGKLGFDRESFLEAAKLGPAVALGARGGSPTDLASAYAALATGNYQQPSVINSFKVGDVELNLEEQVSQVFSSSTVREVKTALGKIGQNYAPSQNVYIGIKTGTASKATHLFLAGYFMPRVNNHDTYSVAMLAVPKGRKRSLGRNAYASTVLGPIMKEFIKRFSRRTPGLTVDEAADFAEEQEREQCRETFYETTNLDGLASEYRGLREANNADALQTALTDATACRGFYEADQNGNTFFELVRGMAAHELSELYEDRLYSGLLGRWGWSSEDRQNSRQKWNYESIAERAFDNVRWSGNEKFRKMARKY
ncbi:MAG: hypothetical protein CMH61_02205 [Nanoarchaeota archaeon]|nr:hypothetical protein [Nanoarchaeota archaeon]|tara:strand:+ start:3920 stop:6382 length:2463 start_codon:yes stop_codon:yes gene_type:complete